jgi:hypothetical protein
MRITTTLLALAGAVSAHYTFPALIYGGTTTTDWQYVRDWTGSYTYDPVTDVTSLDIRCNVNGTTNLAPDTLSVAAGQPLGFTVNPDIYHPGPLMAYMAKVPSGSTAGTWAGDGTLWFKIYQDEPTVGSSALIWPSNGASVCSIYLSRRADSSGWDR